MFPYAHTWEAVTVSVVTLLLLAGFLTTMIWQINITRRARMALNGEEALEKIASDLASSQDTTTRQLQEIAADIKMLRSASEDIERLLKEVG